MKLTFRTLLTVASVVALAAMVVPAAKAQCVPAQHFASGGLAKAGFVQVRIDPTGTENAGNEIGRYWNALNSGFANNFAGGCPSTNAADAQSSWWQTHGASGTRFVSGFIGGGGTVSPCIASSCPNVATDQLLLLVEEWGPSGPPGIGDTAFYTAFQVDATPALTRVWDFARVQGSQGSGAPILTLP